jgi:predicted membrane channel-forming protein YqfA (hemolysin III family)
MEPSWRKPAGMFAILALIVIVAVVVASLSPWIGQLPVLAQVLIYVVLGIVWIAPLKPLLRWMETGRFRD